METRKQILTELQEITPFLGKAAEFRVPYAVPAGYFTNFAEMLVNRVRLETTGFLETASQEISEISPLLAGIQHKNPYQVPEGFFESLILKIPISETISSKLVSVPSFKTQTDSKSFSGKRVISFPMRVVRYATAACIIGLIGIAAFNITYHRNILDPIVGLNTVSDQDMANFLEADDIHWTPGVTSSAETASIDFNDDDIHDLLRSVPDVELEQYSASLPEQKGTVN